MLPKSLKILSHLVEVEEFQSKIDGASGETDYTKNTITIDTNQKPSGVLVTLLHEINHVLNTEWNHEALEWVAQAYAQVITDNPALVDWLAREYGSKAAKLSQNPRK